MRTICLDGPSRIATQRTIPRPQPCRLSGYPSSHSHYLLRALALASLALVAHAGALRAHGDARCSSDAVEAGGIQSLALRQLRAELTQSANGTRRPARERYRARELGRRPR